MLRECRLSSCGGGWTARRQRHVGHAIALLGQIDAGGGFAGAGDADEDDVRLVEGVGPQAVVVFQRELQRFDALVVFVADIVQAGDVGLRRDAGLLGDEVDELAGQVAAGQLELLAALRDELFGLWGNDGMENQAGVGGDLVHGRASNGSLCRKLCRRRTKASGGNWVRKAASMCCARLPVESERMCSGRGFRGAGGLVFLVRGDFMWG